MTNLIVSAAFGYEPEELQPFLRSLYHHASDSIPVLVGDRFPAKTQRKLNDLNPNVCLHEAPRKKTLSIMSRLAGKDVWPNWFQTMLCKSYQTIFAGAPNILANALYIHLARYIYVYDLIEDHVPAADNIILSDIRDVVFQGDPFQFDFALATGLEDIKIEESEHTASWIQAIYGEKELERLKNKRVICSGVTFGKRTKILKYLKALVEQVVLRYEQLFGFKVLGGDQAIHNVLLYSKNSLGANLLENGNPYLATLHHSDLNADNFYTDSEMMLRNNNDNTVNILHQYDRHRTLTQSIVKRWGGQPA